MGPTAEREGKDSDAEGGLAAAVRRDHHRRERALGTRRGVPVAAGHSAGADTVKARLRDAVELGVRS